MSGPGNCGCRTKSFAIDISSVVPPRSGCSRRVCRRPGADLRRGVARLFAFRVLLDPFIFLDSWFDPSKESFYEKSLFWTLPFSHSESLSVRGPSYKLHGFPVCWSLFEQEVCFRLFLLRIPGVLFAIKLIPDSSHLLSLESFPKKVRDGLQAL